MAGEYLSFKYDYAGKEYVVRVVGHYPSGGIVPDPVAAADYQSIPPTIFTVFLGEEQIGHLTEIGGEEKPALEKRARELIASSKGWSHSTTRTDPPKRA